MKNILKILVVGYLMILSSYSHSQCVCDDYKIIEIKDTVSMGTPWFILKLTTKDSCGIGGGGGYSDFWFIDQVGDTINQFTGSGMWLPNPSNPVFDTTKYIIQLNPGYSNFPINFSGNFHIRAPNCTIPFTYSQLNSIEIIEPEALVEIFPNPSNDVFKILNGYNSKITSVAMYNSLGKLIWIEYNEFDELNVSNLKPGIHYVKIYFDDSSVLTRKLIRN